MNMIFLYYTKSIDYIILLLKHINRQEKAIDLFFDA
jgi:hypothetical protein